MKVIELVVTLSRMPADAIVEVGIDRRRAPAAFIELEYRFGHPDQRYNHPTSTTTETREKAVAAREELVRRGVECGAIEEIVVVMP